MNLDAISVFIKVIQCGSFTGAAKLLKMPVSTVSAKISLLESNLGITLIRRTTRKLQITEAGEIYFKGCSHALEEIQAAETAISFDKAEPHGLLKITAPEDIGGNLLPCIVKKYLEKYQKMEVELLITNRIIDLMGEGIDLAIRAGELKDSTLIAKKFMTKQLSLWASPSYLEKAGLPEHPKELNHHEFIKYPFLKDKIIKLTNGNNRCLINIKGRVLLNSSDAAKILTLLGHGIGLLADFQCEEEAKKGNLIKILPEWHWHYLSYFFVYPFQQFVSPKIRTFLSVAEEYLKGL